MSYLKLSTVALLTVASFSLNLQAAGFKFPPPQNMLARAEPMQTAESAPAATESQTVVEIISSNPSLSTLAKAIKAADLTSTLKGEGPFTIFAPNDLAFAKLSPNKLADLLKPENKDKLVALLTYHVVPGNIAAADVKAGKVATVNGKALDVKVKDGTVTVNNAKVIKSDIAGSNGTIHVIDTVLIP